MPSTNSETLTPRRATVPESLGNIKEAIVEIAATERGRMRDSWAHGKQRLRDAQLGLEDYVSTKPLRSLAIAAGLGALAMALLGRRR